MKKLSFLTCLFLSAGAMFGGPIGYKVNYTLTSGSDVITFSLRQQPTLAESCVFSNDCFSVYSTNLVVDGAPAVHGTISFYAPDSGGGMTIMEGDTLLMNNNGPNNQQLFSGTLSRPDLTSFSNLQLVEENIGSPTLDEAFVLNATAPEPGTLKLLFLAVLLSAALLGSRATLARKTSK